MSSLEQKLTVPTKLSPLLEVRRAAHSPGVLVEQLLRCSLQPCRAADFVTFGALDFERCTTCLDVRHRNVNDDELTQVAAAFSPTACSAIGSLPTSVLRPNWQDTVPRRLSVTLPPGHDPAAASSVLLLPTALSASGLQHDRR
jgi:hypothetical protein